MTSNAKDYVMVGFGLGFIFACILLFLMADRHTDKSDRFNKDAIEAGAAYYHHKTGKLTWKHKEAGK